MANHPMHVIAYDAPFRREFHEGTTGKPNCTARAVGLTLTFLTLTFLRDNRCCRPPSAHVQYVPYCDTARTQHRRPHIVGLVDTEIRSHR
jgi:hypothetical protein